MKPISLVKVRKGVKRLQVSMKKKMYTYKKTLLFFRKDRHYIFCSLSSLLCGGDRIKNQEVNFKVFFVYSFLKLFFIFKNKRTRKMKKYVCLFVFYFKNTKNIKNNKLKKQIKFLDNIKMIFFIFSKIIVNNVFKTQTKETLKLFFYYKKK